MNGTVTYFYLTVPDLPAARSFYRDTLGLQEAWREGDTTCAFRLPGSEVQLMLDQRTSDEPQRAGLVFTVPSTAETYQDKQNQLTFHHAPVAIPGDGHWVGAQDGSGNSVYITDIR